MTSDSHQMLPVCELVYNHDSIAHSPSHRCRAWVRVCWVATGVGLKQLHWWLLFWSGCAA